MRRQCTTKGSVVSSHDIFTFSIANCRLPIFRIRPPQQRRTSNTKSKSKNSKSKISGWRPPRLLPFQGSSPTKSKQDLMADCGDPSNGWCGNVFNSPSSTISCHVPAVRHFDPFGTELLWPGGSAIQTHSYFRLPIAD